MNELLARAIIMATKAHKGQTDKADMPYILHPLFLMTKMSSIRLKVIAVLHDVLEDTELCEEDLVDAGFPDDVIEPVKLLTKGGESYDKYIINLSSSWEARRVKLADLTHNLDLRRLTYPLGDSDFKRIAKYQAAMQSLAHIGMGGKLDTIY